MSRKSRKQAHAQSTRHTRTRRLVAGLTTVALIAAACLAVRSASGPEDATAEVSNRPSPSRAAEPKKPTVVAVVNGKSIEKSQIAQICLARYGAETLESLVNKRLIEHYCGRSGIQITDEEIDTEIDRIARRLGFSRQQYLNIIQEHRDISPKQYAHDIVWTTIALRKLAADRVEPTAEEIQKAYESAFGPAVQTRVIILEDEDAARRVHAAAVANPAEFARLARKESKDINSASNGGLIPPIRRRLGDPGVEAAAFQLQPGQISSVLQVAGQFVIMKCEERLPPRNISLERARPQIVERIREKKIRAAAGDVLKKLQETARVENILNHPERRRQMPGVAATINDQPITVAELAEVCFQRNGKAILETEINRRLLVDELARRKVQVTQADIDAEIAHAAELSGVLDPQGRADIPRWIKTVTEEQGVSTEVYIQNAVWPSAALKKLTAGEVQITNEDMKKGFEANYGPRVRCRAIVMDNLRRAQEVWAKARQNATPEFFAKLAKEYSIEPGSRDTGGEVPPIQQHGGRPQLEKEAFKLKPGELSSITQVGTRYVILLCEGRTEPLNVKFEEVRDEIYRDIYEKKLRLAMASQFEEIRSSAQIDNYLAKTTQSPKRAKTDPRVKQASHGEQRR